MKGTAGMLALFVAATVAAAASTNTPTTRDAAITAGKAAAPVLQVYKSATCGCCKEWVNRMREAGFDARVTDLDDGALQAKKGSLGVKESLRSCHTAVVDGYVIEGHVPAADIQRLLRDKPKVAGLAVPGMPMGSPGMEVPGGRTERYDVLTFTPSGRTGVYASHD
jgi:hypothetical protein